MGPLLDFGTTACNLDAARQQLAIITAVYESEQTNLLTMLGTDGQILAWVLQQESWPPSYTLIRSGPNRYFVAIEGTVTRLQAGGHLVGCWARRTPDDSAYVNGTWFNVGEGIRDELLAALPADLSGASFYFSGHSYGSALAHLLANDFAARVGRDKVKVLTFGEPKAISTGYTGPAPVAHWRVDSLNDPVPGLPPNFSLPFAVWSLPVLLWRQSNPIWEHYGTEVVLNEFGVVNGPQSFLLPLPEGVSTDPVSEHLIRNYWGRLKANYARDGGDPVSVAALAFTDATLKQEYVRPVTLELPSVIPGPDGSPVQIPDYSASLYEVSRNISGGNSTVAWKVQLFLELGKTGWSETYYFDGDDSTYETVQPQVSLLANKRNGCFKPALKAGTDFTCTHWRMSQDGQRRDGIVGVLDPNAAVALGPLSDPTPAKIEVPWTAVLCRLYAGRTTWRNLYFRAIPNQSEIGDNGEGYPSAMVVSQVNLWLAALRTAGARIKAIDKGVANPLQPIGGAAAMSGGQTGDTLLTVTGTNVVPGEYVFIEGGPLYASIRGKHLVMGKPDGNTLKIQLPNSLTAPLPAGASLRPYRYAYMAITSSIVDRLVNKKTGTSFAKAHGKRSAKK